MIGGSMHWILREESIYSLIDKKNDLMNRIVFCKNVQNFLLNRVYHTWQMEYFPLFLMESVKAKDLEFVDCFSCLVGLVCNAFPIFTCVLIVCIACCFEFVKLIEQTNKDKNKSTSTHKNIYILKKLHGLIRCMYIHRQCVKKLTKERTVA